MALPFIPPPIGSSHPSSLLVLLHRAIETSCLVSKHGLWYVISKVRIFSKFRDLESRENGGFEKTGGPARAVPHGATDLRTFEK